MPDRLDQVAQRAKRTLPEHRAAMLRRQASLEEEIVDLKAAVAKLLDLHLNQRASRRTIAHPAAPPETA